MSTLAAACAALAGDGEAPSRGWRLTSRSAARWRATVLARRGTWRRPRTGAQSACRRSCASWRRASCPGGEAYEAFIFRTGCVPTRDNLHDLFNGLVWLRFRASKRQLNALHAQQIESAGVGRTRGPLRDALTLFDENAALLQAPEVLPKRCGARDWRGLVRRAPAAVAQAPADRVRPRAAGKAAATAQGDHGPCAAGAAAARRTRRRPTWCAA